MLDKPGLDARCRVTSRALGVFAQQCMKESDENKLDAPVFVSVLLQSTLDLVEKYEAVRGSLQTFQMKFEALQ